MLLDFIRITSETMSKEIPNALITNIDYRCKNGIMIIEVYFYDIKLKTKAFQFAYYEDPNPLIDIEYNLVLEFTAYLDEHVKPIFKNK